MPLVHTARLQPAAGGFKMPDGFRTLVAFQNVPDVWYWEKEVMPPGLDGGNKIDTTTMLNNVWHTYDRPHLKTMTDLTIKAAYDADVWGNTAAQHGLFSEINNNQSISVFFPENSYIDFFGYMQKFMPEAHKEGEMPLADITIVPTNWDPTLYVETGPAFHGAPTT